MTSSEKKSKKPATMRSLTIITALLLVLGGCAAPVEEAPPAQEGPAAPEGSPQVEAPSAEEPAAESAAPEEAPDVVFDTPYYTISLPAELAEGVEFDYNAEISSDPTSGMGLGCSTAITSKETGWALFFVSCSTDNWGVEGGFYAVDLGKPSNLEGWHVMLAHARFADPTTTEFAEDRTAEFARYVTLK